MPPSSASMQTKSNDSEFIQSILLSEVTIGALDKAVRFVKGEKRDDWLRQMEQ